MSIHIAIRTQDDEKVCYWYSEEIHVVWRGREGTQIFDGYGVVPQHIVKKGKDPIRAYVREKAETGVRKQKEIAKRREKKYKALRIPVSVFFKGKLLRGLIGWSEKEEGFVITLKVKDNSQKSCYWGYGEGFGAAMTGKRKFEKDNKFKLTQEAREDAKSILKYLYRTTLPEYMNETETIE